MSGDAADTGTARVTMNNMRETLDAKVMRLVFILNRLLEARQISLYIKKYQKPLDGLIWDPYVFVVQPVGNSSHFGILMLWLRTSAG